jgi:hypothetical protein
MENSDFILMLNQAQGDRQILAKQLGISPHQLSYVTHSNAGEGLLFYGNVIIPFVDRFPKDTILYQIMTSRPNEAAVTTPSPQGHKYSVGLTADGKLIDMNSLLNKSQALK